MILIVRGERLQKPSGLAAKVVVIEAKAGAAGGAAGGNAERGGLSIGTFHSGGGVGGIGPLRGRGDHLGDDGADAVLCLEIHQGVVIAPVVLAGRCFDCRPDEPVAHHVRTGCGGDRMIPRPILCGRIGFAEVHRAKPEGRVGGAEKKRSEEKQNDSHKISPLKNTASGRIGSGGRSRCRWSACRKKDCWRYRRLQGDRCR
jgi:hypothetical protein